MTVQTRVVGSSPQVPSAPSIGGWLAVFAGFLIFNLGVAPVFIVQSLGDADLIECLSTYRAIKRETEAGLSTQYDSSPGLEKHHEAAVNRLLRRQGLPGIASRFTVNELTELEASCRRAKPLLVFEVLVPLASFAFLILVAFWFFKRRKETRTAIIAYFVARGALASVGGLWELDVFGQWPWVFFITMLGPSVVCIPYFAFSERVKRTFVFSKGREG